MLCLHVIRSYNTGMSTLTTFSDNYKPCPSPKGKIHS